MMSCPMRSLRHYLAIRFQNSFLRHVTNFSDRSKCVACLEKTGLQSSGYIMPHSPGGYERLSFLVNNLHLGLLCSAGDMTQDGRSSVSGEILEHAAEA